MNSIPILLDDGKIVGYVEGEIFFKRVKGSLHQLQKPPAWACDIAILQKALDYGAIWIIIRDIETNLIWKVRINDFWGKGSFEIDYGYGIQRVLPLEYWNVSGEKKGEQLSFTEIAAF